MLQYVGTFLKYIMTRLPYSKVMHPCNIVHSFHFFLLCFTVNEIDIPTLSNIVRISPIAATLDVSFDGINTDVVFEVTIYISTGNFFNQV